MKIVSKEPCGYGQFSPFFKILLRNGHLYIRTGSLLLRTALMRSKKHLDNPVGFGAISDICKKLIDTTWSWIYGYFNRNRSIQKISTSH
jgi:hypothetical protein